MAGPQWQRSVLCLFVPALLAPTAAPVDAQEVGLRDRIEQELFTFGDCGTTLCLDLDNLHGDHFIPALAEGNDAVISFVTDAIGFACLVPGLSRAAALGIAERFIIHRVHVRQPDQRTLEGDFRVYRDDE